MKIARIFQASFIFVFVLFSQVNAAPIYQLDDGTGDNDIGIVGYSLPWTWMNAFDAVGGDQITSVGIAWGAGANGLSAKVKIWDDPNNDGNPSDRLELSFIDVVISGGGDTTGTDVFSFYDIADTLVEGSFFVGVEFANDFNTYPARIDQTLTAGKSWVGTLDGVLPLALIDSYGYPGNWMIRATGNGAASVPEPSTIVMLGAGLLGLLAATRRSARH